MRMTSAQMLVVPEEYTSNDLKVKETSTAIVCVGCLSPAFEYMKPPTSCHEIAPSHAHAVQVERACSARHGS